ncbi:histidine triad nucleotide-binding protein [Desulfuromonas sp. AOP6]|uniref:histidine triad nucleotide-binding protein n=1 Tax=Desulfuromonas sp. AOP6 TaxID=1566351 RepID=UPI00126F8F88|nr:histidine triad nucleotide-binding protein [Desulfuromonas sp. AOP6]BCA79829.1 histidine triad nucleotide-binding protein [Desulfuromonas sp. AOP6]
MSTNCVFCKIISGDIPGHIVYQDDLVVAIEDINPQAPHHYLLVPKKHIATTLDLSEGDETWLGHLYLVAGNIAKEKGFAEEGFRVVNNCNAAAGQTVWHIHFHLLGGREMSWPPG